MSEGELVTIREELEAIMRSTVEQIIEVLRRADLNIEARIEPADRETTREKIERFVREHGPLTSGEIANYLVHDIFTKSSDPRSVITSTVSMLVREHILERLEDGRVAAKECSR